MYIFLTYLFSVLLYDVIGAPAARVYG